MWMFTAGVAVTAKNWKQSKCPSTEGWKNCDFFLEWKININYRGQTNSIQNRDESHRRCRVEEARHEEYVTVIPFTRS